MNAATKQLIANAREQGLKEGHERGFVAGHTIHARQIKDQRFEAITKLISANSQALEAQARLIQAAERQY